MTDYISFINQYRVIRNISNRYVLASSLARFLGALSFYDNETENYTIHSFNHYSLSYTFKIKLHLFKHLSTIKNKIIHK